MKPAPKRISQDAKSRSVKYHEAQKCKKLDKYVNIDELESVEDEPESEPRTFIIEGDEK
jgi:hypothetical protein